MKDYAGFLQRLRALGWWVGLAPLEDHAFNRCKADTKWVEYTLAGTAAVAADLPVYHRACADGAGLLAASGAGAGWEAQVGRLLASRRLRDATLARARERLAARYGHAELGAQVLAMVERARAPAAPAPQAMRRGFIATVLGRPS